MKPQNPAQKVVNPRKLILHFDVNKTIMVNDASDPTSKEIILMELASAYSWGKVEQKDEKSLPDWKLQHFMFSVNPPAEDMISYKDYAASQYPFKTSSEEPNEAERIKFNQKQKAQQKKLLDEFIQQGGKGAKLKNAFSNVMRYLTLPNIVIQELGLKDKMQEEVKHEEKENTSGHYNMHEIFYDGKYQLLPSFFNVLVKLKKLRREYAVVFRTFQNNLDRVVYEFNLFCSGDHPCYNGRNNATLVRLDGSKGTKNFKIDDIHKGVLHRFSDQSDDVALVMGTLNRKEGKSLEDAYASDIAKKSVKVYKGCTNMYLAIMESLKERCALAIQDDFKAWNTNREKVSYAKPFFIDETDYDTLQIFFDDNITEDEDTIVDTRDIIEKTSIPIRKAMNKYLVKVDSFRAITETDYFFKMIDLCEKARVDEIDRIEKGPPPEERVIPEKSEWEKLMELSDADFLRKTVLPIIYPIIDNERPEDPLKYLAYYLLKNKNKIKMPSPPEKEPVEEEKHAEDENEEQQQIQPNP